MLSRRRYSVGPLSTNFLFWPITPVAESTSRGISCELSLSGLYSCIFGPLEVIYLIAELTLLGTAAVLWWADGRPAIPFVQKGNNAG